MSRTYIQELRSRGIQLTVAGDQLRISAPKGTLTAELAQTLKERKPALVQALREEEAARHQRIAPRPDRALPAPLSFQQQRLWFIDQFSGPSPVYNISTAFRVHGALDEAAFLSAFDTIVRRHDALRTRVEVVDGIALQRVDDALAPTLSCTDLQTPAERRDEVAMALYREQDRTRFDIGTGPLVEIRLYRFDLDDHLLLTNVHHLVFDGWSSGVMVRELAELYEAAIEGREPRLPALELQYGDYAAWQRHQLDSGAWDGQLAYWRDQLRGLPPLLELPLDRPRPQVQRNVGATRPVALGAAISAGLAAFSKHNGVSPYMTVLAAFMLVLGRYARQDDVAVGTMIANRNRSELEGLIGFFANTLVLRSRLDAASPFLDHVRAVRQTVLGAFEHQDAPFEHIVESLQVERSSAHTPLFQVMYVWQGATTGELRLPGLHFSDVYRDSGHSKFDLTLTLVEGADGVRGGLQYNTDLFDPESVDAIIDSLSTVLQAVLADPTRRLQEIPLIDAARRDALLPPPATPSTFAPGDAIHTRFDAACAADPQAVAVACGTQRVAYAQLRARAAAIAAALRTAGVGRGDRVALFIGRSVDAVAAMIGVLKVGACYVPVDPTGPRQRLRHILGDAGAAAALIGESLEATFAEVCDGLHLDLPAIRLDTVPEAADPVDVPDAEVTPQDPAYVIYTSGSTGKPKGSVIPHGHVLRLFDATAHWFDFGREDVWTFFHSYAFDFSVWEIWGALLYGGRLVVVPYETSRNPADFHALLAAEGVTVLNQTPSAFMQLMQADADAPQAQRDGLRLRYVVFGGEALDLPALRPWFARHGDRRPRLINMYGITETTVHVTYREIDAADAEQPRSLIGRPIPDLQLYVLDEDMQPVPHGVLGEIHVGGAGLAQAYLHRPELTAQRFVPHPWSELPGERLYRTGDLARVTRDGDLEYAGRSDEQIKIRGFRIELGEIEHAIAAQAWVDRAIVRLVDLPDQGKRLVAYCTTREGHEAAGDGELHAALKSRLPEYMLPSAFVRMAAFPLTENGKIDYRALPLPEAGGARQTYAAPRDDRERRMLAVWSTVLGVEGIGIDDNYFALGGDSIRSIQLIAAARAEGIRFTLPQLFAQQSVAELAAVAEFDGADADDAARAPFALVSAEQRAELPDDVEDAYPLSALQAGMIYHSMANPEKGHYHNVSSLKIDGCPMRPALFERAVEEVAARHPILRTSFRMDTFGVPLQLVHRQARAECTFSDLSALSEAERTAAVDTLIETQKRTPFDLARAPLFRIFVQQSADDAFQITWVDHHAILDGWSVASFFTEVFERYFHLYEGRDFDPAPIRSFYRDYVAAERRALADESARRHWAETIADAPFLALPRPESAPSAEDGEFRHQPQLPDDISERLRSVAKRLGVPVRTLLLSAHLKVMSMLSGQTDVLSGVVGNGRLEEDDGERCLGLFLNTLPMRVRLRAGAAWSDVVAEVFRAEQAMLAHRRFPLAEIQRMNGGDPLFDVAFNFISFHVLRRMDDGVPSGFRAEQREQFQRNSFALMCGFRDDPGSREVSLDLQYDPERIDRDLVARAGRCYARVLAAMTGTPDARHDAEDMLADADTAQLHRWEDGGQSAPQAASFHALFAAQRARTPDAPALEADGGVLTYAELDARVERLAAHLAALGVRDEARVAVCLPRGLDLPVALLAVSRCGGCYVPLDPQYPDSRLAYIVEDAQPLLVLTHAALVDKFDAARHAPLCMDRIADDAPLATPCDPPSPERLSHIIYTSGSTGQPKGVAIRRRSTVAMLDWALALYGADAFRRTLASTSICFDLSVYELFAPLACGGCVVLVDSMLELTTRDVGEVTLVNTVPSALNAILDAGRLPRGVRFVNVAGEPLPRALVDKAYAVPGVEAVYNLYGPSEDTTYSTFARVPAGNGEKPSIGRPLAGSRAHVLDAALNRVAPGSVGELYLSGIGLGRGYWDRADLTADRFMPCPFADQPGARMYRTGDLVRFRADGELDFLGRVDHQVKVRGFRIELGEIEHVLSGQPGVAACAAMVQEHAPGQKRVVAYVAADPGATLEEAALIERLRGQLPEFMVPARIAVLAAMPATPNGKIDRKALPAIVDTASESGPVATPVGEIECLLAEVWSDALGHPVGDRHANFFALGGDSILSIQIVARMRRLGYDLTPRKLFEHPTLAELARQLGRADGSRTVCEQGPVSGEVALTPVQHWFFAQALERAEHWNQAVALDVHPDCDRSTVESALRLLLAQHDMLRARFEPEADGLRQWLPAETPAFALETVALGAAGSEEAERGWRAAADALQASLRPDEGRVFAGLWAEHEAGARARLLLVAHHLVVDAVSWRILLEDLQAACEALLRGARPQLPEKSTAFRYWAQRLSAHVADGGFEGERAYWETVAAADCPALPLDLQGRNDVASSRNVVVALDEDETRALLREAPAAFNTEINDLLLTALALAIVDWTGARVCGLTLEGHGREDLFEDVDLSRTVGWFTTMYPVALTVDPAAGLDVAIKSVKEQLRSIPGKGIGYGALRHLGDASRAEALRAPAHAGIGFNYLGQFDGGGGAATQTLFAGAPAPLGDLHAPVQLRGHVLDVTGAVASGRLSVNWTYSANLHRADTIEGVAARFLECLRGLIAFCRQPGVGGRTPSDFPLIALSQAEIDAVIAAAPEGVQSLEDVYPATPLQQGLLYHSLLDAEGGTYLTHMSYEVVGAFDPDAFIAAWNHVLAQHAILRTAFAGLDGGRLAQVVLRDVVVPCRREDWRGQDEAAQSQAWQELMARDRAVGFDFATAPLLRLHLVRIAQDRHKFLLSYHHALLDGWSIPLLLGELFDAYERATSGQPLQATASRPYRDYMQWLRRQPVDSAADYWRTHLAGIEEPTRLHGVAPVAPPIQPDFGVLRRQLPQPLFRRLDALVRREGLTLNIVTQAAWALVLGLHAARNDVVFGITTSGRPVDLDGAEGMIGLFINTVPARVRLASGDSVLDLLRTMHAEQVRRDEHSHLPLPEIQALSGVRGDTPLFGSLVVFENYPVGGPPAPVDGDDAPLQANLLATHEQSNYPLGLCIVPNAEGVVVNLNHDRRLHGDADAATLLERYERALEQIADGAQRPLGTLDLLLDRERDALRRWSEGRRDDACTEESFLARFARIVREQGARPAVVEGARTLNYAGLARAADRLARRLHAAGVRRGDVVGLFHERGIDAIVAMLAVIKAGAVYLPVDPAYPEARIRLLLEDAAPTAVLTRSGLHPEVSCVRIDLDRAPDGMPLEGMLSEGALSEGTLSDGMPEFQPTPDDAAYMIYTSGSTGRPKGTLLSHRGLANTAIGQVNAFAMTPEDRVLQFASISFDASVWEVSIALMAGASLHIVTDEGRRLGAEFAGLLEQARPTFATLPPSLLRNLEPSQFPELRALVSAGEACDADIVRRWSAGRDVWNAYGPTEVSICATHAHFRDSVDAPGIGGAIANASVRVLDADLREVPPGVPGEIWVGGAGLAHGYWRRPDLTAERFMPDPFSATPGARLYRTGDLGRYRDDGGIDFLGRIDHQVKVRGFRVELAEIEARLLAVPGIADAVVVAREDALSGTRLQAYVVGADGDAPDLRALRTALRETLPDYMIPGQMMALERLPLNVNGKVDRDRLPAFSDVVAEPGADAPASETERALAAIWQELLGVAAPGVDDDFFDVGGNSLAAMQVVTRIRESLLPDIGIDSVYQNPRLGDLARCIDNRRWMTAGVQEEAEGVFEDLL